MATLNENIAKIEEGSTTETLYNRLLAGMDLASQETLPDFLGSDYVTMSGGGDYAVNTDKINAEISEYQSITRKNTAYLLADAVTSSLGVGSSGGIAGAVAITGDSMTGQLNAMYGFAAGDDGIKIFDVYRTKEEDVDKRKNRVDINGELHLSSYGLYINDWNVLSYDNDILLLNAGNISLDGDVVCSGTITLGDLVISGDGVLYGDLEFYHSGNCNNEDTDWTMRKALVAGKLTVKGTSEFRSGVQAYYGVDLGYNGSSVFAIYGVGEAQLKGDLLIAQGGGIKLDDNYVVRVKNNKVVSFSATGMILNLGDDDTAQINLQADIWDDDNDYKLIGKYGDAYFPNSFQAGHQLGNVLIETYKNTTDDDGEAKDAGIILSRYLRFKSDKGPGFYSDGVMLNFEGPFQYNITSDDDTIQTTSYQTTQISYQESESLYAPLSKKSSSLTFSTEADFYVFDKPIEGRISLGIANSKTRLLDNQLFFDDSIYWQVITDGVKFYGNGYFVNDIGSVSFSSGFAGSGWKILTNQLTGNVSATFDELTIRKKMRIYELEVQKQSVTNGSLWVSDSCSGDTAEEIA